MTRRLRALLASIFLFSLGFTAFAQNTQIQGQVSDASGAVIPKALVRVVDQNTGTERTAQTNGSGQYLVPGLDPSLYKVFVQAEGFSTAVSTPITLNVGQNAVLDFKMQVGETSQSVTVDASGLQIDTIGASVSTVVDRQFVANIPLNGRSFQSLMTLARACRKSQSMRPLGSASEPKANSRLTGSERRRISLPWMELVPTQEWTPAGMVSDLALVVLWLERLL